MFEYLGTPFAREDRTASTTVLSLTAATYFTTDQKARYAVVTVEAQPIRYTRNGATPDNAATPPVGDVHSAGNDPIILHGQHSIKNFRFYRSGGTDASVHVTYYV